ncbi:MAG: sensor histidine kinase [Magnetococcales bacterium]|nr:sensor histidine kinase [Magnetococcales bacterium]
MSTPSLRRHLALGLALVLIPVLFGQWLAVSIAVERLHADYVTSRLRHDAEALLAALSLTEGEPPRLLPTRIDPIYLRPWSGHYYRIQEGQTVLFSRSLWDFTLVAAPPPTTGDAAFSLPGPNGQSLLAWSRLFHKQGRALTVLVAEDVGSGERTVRAIQFWYGMAALLALIILLAMQGVLLRRVLDPLRRATDAVRQLARGETRPLPTDALFVEVLPFVEAINRLLGHLTDQLTRSRQASANLAHALKTPLALLLQWTQEEALARHPELQGRMQRQIILLGARASRVLKHIRVAGAATTSTHVDLTSELNPLIDMMRQMHHARALRITLDLPAGLHARIDREDLLEMVGNLLDNACKWARQSVRCHLACDGETLRLLVEDDGPGCPPEQHTHILMHGGRADTTVPGHGIGLAVVHEIVQGYRGQLTFGVSEALGGFSVQVVLELLPRPSDNHPPARA